MVYRTVFARLVLENRQWKPSCLKNIFFVEFIALIWSGTVHSLFFNTLSVRDSLMLHQISYLTDVLISTRVKHLCDDGKFVLLIKYLYILLPVVTEWVWQRLEVYWNWTKFSLICSQEPVVTVNICLKEGMGGGQIGGCG